MNKWFYARGKEKTGPVSEVEIFQKIKEKEVTEETFVWRAGMEQWTAAGKIAELSSHFSPVPPLFPTMATEPFPPPPLQFEVPSSTIPGESSHLTKMEVGSIFSEAMIYFKKNFAGLSLVVLVYFVLNIISTVILNFIPIIGQIANIFIQVILTLGAWKACLAAVDGQEVRVDLLFSQAKFGLMAGLAHLCLGITVCGFAVLFLIPGLIVTALFNLWSLLVVDQGTAPFHALNESYYLVKPHLGTFLLLMLTTFLIVLLGLICLIVGIIPATALSMLLLSTAYRRLVPRTSLSS